MWFELAISGSNPQSRRNGGKYEVRWNQTRSS